MIKISQLPTAVLVGATLTLSPPLAHVAGAQTPIAAASTCIGALKVKAFSETFPRWGEHDIWLIAEAVRAEVNKERCAAGLSHLAPDQTLIRAAEIHTSDMIARDFFDHLSPVPARRTPSDRITAAGGEFRLTAENLAQAWYLSCLAPCSWATDLSFL